MATTLYLQPEDVNESLLARLKALLAQHDVIDVHISAAKNREQTGWQQLVQARHNAENGHVVTMTWDEFEKHVAV